MSYANPEPRGPRREHRTILQPSALNLAVCSPHPLDPGIVFCRADVMLMHIVRGVPLAEPAGEVGIDEERGISGRDVLHGKAVALER